MAVKPLSEMSKLPKLFKNKNKAVQATLSFRKQLKMPPARLRRDRSSAESTR